MSQSRPSARVSALLERWREPVAMALAALVVAGMLAVGISRTHERPAPGVSPADFFAAKPTLTR